MNIYNKERVLDYTSDIMLEAASLEEGSAIRIICPSCGGGRTKERSLSVRKDGNSIKWVCFRASCEVRGYRSTSGKLVCTRKTPRKQKITPYTKPLAILTDEQKKYLAGKYGLHDEHLSLSRVMFAPEDDRFAFPILSPVGKVRGYALRTHEKVGCGGPTEKSQSSKSLVAPKALTRMSSPEPHLSYYMPRDCGLVCIVVVEDIPSALRAAKYMPSVALLGTGCGPDYANEIASRFPEVIWALDEDALSLSIRWHKKYQMLFQQSTVLPLKKDLKDMEEEELKSLLKPYLKATSIPNWLGA